MPSAAIGRHDAIDDVFGLDELPGLLVSLVTTPSDA
jgi:hypothetical protein